MTALEILRLYEHARDTQGMTVAEWESAHGFPPFTVYPRARLKRKYMYRVMTDEERRRIRISDRAMSWRARASTS